MVLVLLMQQIRLCC